jgi:hypothetical protein
MITAALATAGVAAVADDLDAALEAQRKKAQHRVYSESALLEDRNLTVPQAKTEKEQALDKKLREMDARADAPSRLPDPSMLRPVAQTMPVRPTEPANWLTPAMLDDSAAVELPDNKDGWLVDEMERQKAKKDQTALMEEQKTADNFLHEKMQEQSTLSEINRLNQYPSAPPQNISSFNKRVPSSSDSSFVNPESDVSLLQPSLLPESRNPPAASLLFSPQESRASSPLSQDPLQQSKSVWSGSSPFSPSSSSFSPRLDVPAPVTLSPLQRIKKSSPINKADPFADDHMPQFKNSIWD